MWSIESPLVRRAFAAVVLVAAGAAHADVVVPAEAAPRPISAKARRVGGHAVRTLGEHTLVAIWGSGDDLFAVGDTESIHSGDGGGTWTRARTGTMLPAVSVWGTSRDDVYAGTVNGVVLHTRDAGRSWQTVFIMPSYGGSLHAAWASGPNDVYLVGAMGGWNHSADGGRTWSSRSDYTGPNYEAIAGGGPASLWYVVDPLRKDGGLRHSTDHGATSTRSTLPLPTDYFPRIALWVDASGVYVAAGSLYSPQSDVYRSDDEGKSWMHVGATKGVIYALWGDGRGELWAVGGDGLVLRAHGQSLRALPRVGNKDLNGVWGTAAGRVFAVGEGGIVVELAR